MPATRYKARINDVDGDGRPDTEWAVIRAGGLLLWGVTTAAGATIEESDGFASGGQRTVSIGTLATGQTVALPSDGHLAELRVLHGCRWVAPDLAGTRQVFGFATAYGSPDKDFLGAGGACVNGRLYQVDTETALPGVQTAIRENISANDTTVTTATTRVQLTTPIPPGSSTVPDAYGGACLPSKLLLPAYEE